MNTEKKICSKCNKELKPTDAFCTECGNKIDITAPDLVNGVPVYTCPKCKRKLPPGNSFCINCGQNVQLSAAMVNNTTINCTRCNTVLKPTDVFCTECGQRTGVAQKTTSRVTLNNLPSASVGTPFVASSIPDYNLTIEQYVTQTINKEITKSGEKLNISIAPLERRKNILSFVYSVILLICLSLWFYHSNIEILVIVFGIVTLIYISMVRKYNLTKYLLKEVQSRPDEKIGYIVSSVLTGKVNNGKYKLMRFGLLLISVVIPLIVFSSPHTIFEYDSLNKGYVVRFYTIGWLNKETELEIPSEYQGEPVVGIRGDVFANVKSLEKVKLPDTIKEIRGGAFRNASNLEEFNIPDGIPEIKGETFQGCSSLKEITIPDSVTRIGGHAFRENYSLSKVNISSNSKLKEIGSSAFRDCYKLDEIYLPKGVSVDSRSFKGSGTSVKYYTVDGLSLSDFYEYSSYDYLLKGDVEEINAYRSEAKLQNATISLLSVEGSRGNYSFKLQYVGPTGSETFVLSRNNPYKRIGDLVAFEVKNDYAFDSSSTSVSLNIYYN